MSRIIDILMSFLLIVLTSPLWFLVILLILIFSPGKPFFAHTRVGQGSRAFRLVKFRTMHSAKTVATNLTVSGDSRITSIGRFLRRYKLDELPQLLNILIGSMTFVGPRPETADFVAHYTSAQKEILKYKPGLTDPASLKYRYEERILAGFSDPVKRYLERILPDKIDIGLEYQRNRSWSSDIKIIIRTLGAVFRTR